MVGNVMQEGERGVADEVGPDQVREPAVQGHGGADEAAGIGIAAAEKVEGRTRERHRRHQHEAKPVDRRGERRLRAEIGEPQAPRGLDVFTGVGPERRTAPGREPREQQAERGPGDTASQPLSLPSDQLNRYVATEIVYIGTISQRISDNVTRDTGVTDPPPVTVTQDGNTNIIKMSMSADSAELAAAMADSAANSYIEDWKQRNPKDAQRSEDRYVVKASADTATRTNDPAITIGVGAALGLCVGVVWAYLRARWRLADEADTADTADTTDAADGPGERA